MITLAILYWLAGTVGGKVGENWFYEDLPIDPKTGAVTKTGVFAQTVQAPREQGEDYHSFIDLTVLAGENITGDDGKPMPEKQATDSLADSIEDAVVNALDDPNAWDITIPTTGERFYDCQITPSTGKQSYPPLPNGAVPKSLEIEVWYKKG